MWSPTELNYASMDQISLKLDDLQLRYIFKMVAIRHLEFVNFATWVKWRLHSLADSYN